MAQANADNITIPTRRSMLGILTAAALVPSIPARAGTSASDGELLALLEQMPGAYQAQDDAERALFAAKQAAAAQCSEIPIQLRMKMKSTGEVWLITRDEIETIRELYGANSLGVRNPHGEEHYRRLMTDLEQWEATCAHIDAECGVPEATAELEAALDRILALSDALIDVPAGTLAGLLIKLAVALGTTSPDVATSELAPGWADGMGASLLRDMLSMHATADPEKHRVILAALEPVVDTGKREAV